MPFPLAHPAAILPLRRWCPGRFDFAALIIGSIAPDLATCIDDWEYFSHTLAGSVVFCVPAGLLTYRILHRVRAALARTLPTPHREALLPLCSGLPSPLVPVISSILVASWLHILCDLFTHDHSGLREYVPFLFRASAGSAPNRVLWLLGSVLGCAVLGLLYLSRLAQTEARWWVVPKTEQRAYLLWLGLLLLPFLPGLPLTINDMHPGFSPSVFVRALAMYYLGCAYVTLAVAGFVFRSRMPLRS